MTTTETNSASLLARRQAAVARGPFHVAPIFAARAEGAWITDVDGRRYVDFCGGLGTANVGHNHPRVLAAMAQQTERFVHTCFHVVPYEAYVRLAERLNELVPIGGPCKTALFNSGAEAVENAVKISRAATGRSAVVSFERGFHGRTLLGMTLTGKCRPYAVGFGPFAPEIYRLPYEPFFAPPTRTASEVERACGEALAHLAAYHVEPADVACLVVEPVLGEGGFLPLHTAAFPLLRRWSDAHGIVLVCDEVQTGFGRCGALFACQRFGVEPDLVTLGKSLGAGSVLSGVTGRAQLMDAPIVGGLGGTYGGNPVACAAALAVLDVMVDEGLPARALSIGEAVMAAFRQWQQRYPFVGDVRGLGAMCGLELVAPGSTLPDPACASRICERALERGLLVMTASGHVLRTLMPLCIDDPTLERGLGILGEALAAEA